MDLCKWCLVSHHQSVRILYTEYGPLCAALCTATLYSTGSPSSGYHRPGTSRSPACLLGRSDTVRLLLPPSTAIGANRAPRRLRTCACTHQPSVGRETKHRKKNSAETPRYNHSGTGTAAALPHPRPLADPTGTHTRPVPAISKYRYAWAPCSVFFASSTTCKDSNKHPPHPPSPQYHQVPLLGTDTWVLFCPHPPPPCVHPALLFSRTSSTSITGSYGPGPQ